MGLHLDDIVIEPIVSEKSWRAQDERKYTFRVHLSANKVQIRKAIEQIFKVKVEKVWTMNRQGKPRQVRFYQPGRKSSWKKAVVQLAPGQRIEIHR